MAPELELLWSEPIFTLPCQAQFAWNRCFPTPLNVICQGNLSVSEALAGLIGHLGGSKVLGLMIGAQPTGTWTRAKFWETIEIWGKILGNYRTPIAKNPCVSSKTMYMIDALPTEKEFGNFDPQTTELFVDQNGQILSQGWMLIIITYVVISRRQLH